MQRFFRDAASGYGWASVLLHWLTAVIIVVMLFFGDSIAVSGREMLVKHIGLGLMAYPLLWFRIVFRLLRGHPRRLPTQKNSWLYRLAVWAHYLLITALAVLLLTGPLIAISRGGYQFVILSAIPLPDIMRQASVYHTVHAYAAAVLAIVIALHILAVLKHVAWNRDGTLEKMIIPAIDQDQSNA